MYFISPKISKVNSIPLCKQFKIFVCNLKIQLVLFTPAGMVIKARISHGMVNWQLPKQGILWPVSCDHITSSELIKVTCFFFKVDSWPTTGFWLDCGLKSA